MLRFQNEMQNDLIKSCTYNHYTPSKNTTDLQKATTTKQHLLMQISWPKFQTVLRQAFRLIK